MEKYAGKEAVLLDQILHKYAVSEDLPVLLAELLGRCAPARLGELERLLERYRGREAELYRSLCDQYLPLLSPDDPVLTLGVGERLPAAGLAEVYRGLVERTYRRYNPGKLQDLDSLMNKFQGREAELLDQVTRKYVFSARRPAAELQALFAEFLARFDPARLPGLTSTASWPSTGVTRASSTSSCVRRT